MKKIVVLSVLLVGCSTALFAVAVPPAPEIDAGSVTTASVLLGAGLLMLRGRRRSR